MIGFGELRRISLQWQLDISEVERAYATSWILKGIFDQVALATGLALRGGSALRYAHLTDYPFADAPEFWMEEDKPTPEALGDALRAAATASGLKFSLVAVGRGSASVEYTGPLGRRSAAQPHIILSFMTAKSKGEPVWAPLIHRFSDTCMVMVRAQSLEDIAAELLAVLRAFPRARSVFDLWFITSRGSGRINPGRVYALAQEIAQSKQLTLPGRDGLFNPTHREVLERGWNNALRADPHRPSFEQAERDLIAALDEMVSI